MEGWREIRGTWAAGGGARRPADRRPAALLIVLVGLLAAGGIRDIPASAAKVRTYTDTVGDVTCCTRDISEVRVANDDAGMIAFAVTARDVPADEGIVGDDDDLIIQIDADDDRSTGDPNGIDYQLFADVAARQVDGLQLSRWREERQVFHAIYAPRVRASATRDVFRFMLDRHLLGDTDRFRFMVSLHEVTSLGGSHHEFAPEGGGMWSYRVALALGRIRPALTTTAPARAGRPFVARLALDVAESGMRLASGRILCRASVAGRRLSVLRNEFVARRAVCEWRIPRRTRGARVRGEVGVQVTRSLSVSRTFRSRIVSPT